MQHWDLLALTPSVCEQILARIYDRRLALAASPFPAFWAGGSRMEGPR